MPSAAARRLYEDQIPSFMSVFDLDAEAMMEDRGTITVVDPKIMEIDPDTTKLSSEPQPLHPAAIPSDATLHKHHDSTSTQNTESADSSPTTTVSCTDSSSLSDPSPSSSPDSPINNLIPLSSFPGPTFGGLSSMATLTVSEPTLERPMTSPSPRRPRNMKGLSIQPPFAGPPPSSLVSEPSSPVFIKPKIPAMKRKPSQLSLKTSSNDLIRGTALEIPQSPSLPPILQRRALKHSTSSPHMLSGLKSSTFGPVGGMTIPTVLERNESGLSEFFRPSKPALAASGGLASAIPEEASPIRAQVANCAAFDVEPFHENENNEDQKTPGYPDGPIAIYGEDVFLYLEPSADEASRFDVVINVAREVSNPFEAMRPKQIELPAKQNTFADDSPMPDTALTGLSFATAFEFPQEDVTPTTPKAAATKEPEYIHMLWDHNTDIAPDLMGLCETIDRRVQEGKKVLVHCQQGASRSASLIIAYGLYQNPDLSVNDAYYAAQSKSRWISPNMRLMYCLQDFQKEVSRKKRLTPGSTFRPRSGKKSPTKHRQALSVDAIELPPKEPLTAPLPGEESASISPERSPMRPRGSSTPGRDPVSPGPSSAPSSFSWTEREDENDPGKFGRFNIDSIFKHSQPDSGFASSSSLGSTSLSLSKPPLSPGLPPAPITVSKPRLPPPSLGFAPLSIGRPPPSPGLPGHAPLSLGAPPLSPGFAPPSFGRPPPSPGLPRLAPLKLGAPPLSPGFAPPSFGKPPPSPGFGAHRFKAPTNGFGLVPLSLGGSSRSVEDLRGAASDRPLPMMPAATFLDDDALLSPRVEKMTRNPLHDPFPDFGGMRFVEVPPTPNDGLFSPREAMFPRDPFFPFGRPTQVADPRSPPTQGETPIVRSIDELL